MGLQEHSAGYLDTLCRHPGQFIAKQRSNCIADIIRQTNASQRRLRCNVRIQLRIIPHISAAKIRFYCAWRNNIRRYAALSQLFCLITG